MSGAGQPWYLIRRITFCNLENRLGNAVDVTPLGIVQGEAEADRLLTAMREAPSYEVDGHTYPNQYKGWDNETYPKYTKVEVSVLELSTLKASDDVSG